MAPPAAGRKAALNFRPGWAAPAARRAALNFGNDQIAPKPEQYVFPGAWDSLAFGAAHLSTLRQSLALFGWSESVFGRAALANKARLLHPRGWDAQGAGWPLLRVSRMGIHPRSIHGLDVGEPFIANHTREVHAGGAGRDTLWGRPRLENLLRHVKAGGWDAQAPGQTWISHERRRIEPQGLNAARWGQAWLSHGARALGQREWDSQAFGLPRLSPTRYIWPDGFDAIGWGERITPAPQYLLLPGLAPLPMQPERLFNYVQHIRPAGFQSNVQEHLRWGWASLHNRTQYIHVQDDGLGGMAGDFPAMWTELLNRNRQVGAFGFAATRWGDALLHLNARLLEPPGADASTFGTAFIAWAKQPLPLAGWDSAHLSQWTALRNKAVAVEATGWGSFECGQHSLADRTQRIQWFADADTQAFGRAWLADAVRPVTVQGLHSIEPPALPAPTLHLHTRYLHPRGPDSAGVGGHWLQERFNIISPRWTKQRDDMGEPRLANVTPEIHLFGHDAQEFGQSLVRLQWRPLLVKGDEMARVGQHRLAERRQWLAPTGWPGALVSDKARLFNAYQPPPDPTQRVFPKSIYESGTIAVPPPTFNRRSLGPQSWDGMALGTPKLIDSAILPKSLEDTADFGKPALSNSRRYLVVAPFPDDEVTQPPAMRVDPLTIWVGLNAPAQARRNHPPLVRNPDPPSYGAVFGQARIFNRIGPPMRPSGFDAMRFDQPRIENARKYVLPPGWLSFRGGYHHVVGGDLQLEQFDAADTLTFGKPRLGHVNSVQRLLVRPMDETAWGLSDVQNQHRALGVSGWDSLLPGQSGDGPRYMRQRLWIGAPDWPVIGGGDMSEWGLPWLSHAVREIKPEGGDMLALDDEPGQYALRMRVQRGGGGPTAPAAQRLRPRGLYSARMGLPDVQPRVQKIFPDGAGDMFRKGGGWQAS